MNSHPENRIVFLHGWNRSTASWSNNAPAFVSRGYVTQLCRLPGFDLPVPQAPWGVAEYADFVAKQLTANPELRTIVVGHSFGARIAMYLAVHHSHLVQAVVLSAAAGLRNSSSVKQRIVPVLSGALRLLEVSEHSKRATTWLRKWGRTLFASASYKATPDALRPVMKRVLSLDFENIAPLISQPTLILWGKDDSVTPVSMGHRLKQLIPDSHFVLVRGAGHRLHETHSSLWNDRVINFIESLEL